MNVLHRFVILAVLFLLVSIGLVSRSHAQDSETQILISELYDKPWNGVELIGQSPTMWDFGLTEPMSKILKTGKPAQSVLLRNLNSYEIRAQIIFLLGGVGDETAIEPIIDSMIPESRIPTDPSARLVNRSANIALTNITVADVIWHHGGGIVIEQCPKTPKECWQSWWSKNGSTFRVDKITQSRRYSNYPGYGIYKGLK